MKNKIANIINVILILTVALLLSGCYTTWGTNIDKWWKSPATQASVANGVSYAEQAATQFAINAGLAALQQYAGGGKLNYQQIAITGGINTLYMQAQNIRQIQGTTQVLDPIATAQALQSGGTSEQIAQKLAQQLVDNANALIKAGATPNQASEVNAMAFDKAAAVLTAATTK